MSLASVARKPARITPLTYPVVEPDAETCQHLRVSVGSALRQLLQPQSLSLFAARSDES